VKGGQLERKADLTAVNPFSNEMWEPRRLTILWASTACYRDSSTSFFCLKISMSCLKIRVEFPTLVNDEFEIRNVNKGTHPSSASLYEEMKFAQKKSWAHAIFNSQMFAAVNSNNGKVNNLFLWLFPQFQ
jgi:hypothetical protein